MEAKPSKKRSLRPRDLLETLTLEVLEAQQMVVQQAETGTGSTCICFADFCLSSELRK